MSATQTCVRIPGTKMKVFDTTLTVAAAATSATVTSNEVFCGQVVRVEIDPGAAMTTSATLKGYEANTALATGTREHFINYTFPASEVELVIRPLAAAVAVGGGALTTATSVPIYVSDQLTIDLESATAADATRVRVYVLGEPIL